MSADGQLLLAELLLEQRVLRTPVVEIAEWNEAGTAARRFEHLIPLSRPAKGEQYAFEVNLDACTGCKACVVACHSLNGLDDDESWRDVGAVVDDDGTLQTITTACHHCADPACANGCPVLAYDKDEGTGIVRHLDDQCIGCSYCQMKCPYDVPKWNVKRGIVRKCDMCQGRLAEGEAPACVQACPNEAIKIRIIRKGSIFGKHLVPGAVDSAYTRPSTRYVGELKGRPADVGELRVENSHAPLAWMLVLTQFSAGLLFWMLIRGITESAVWAAALAGLAGIGLSTAHLGQPFKAWRAFLGWRKSWLSREILAFGAYAPPLGILVFRPSSGVLAAAFATGFAAVACSVMVYADTRRPFWNGWLVSMKFFGSMFALGLAFHGQMWGVLLLAAMDTLFVWKAWKDAGVSWHRSARVLMGKLQFWMVARWVLIVLALLVPHGWLAALASVVVERLMFFKACASPRMPGN